MKHGGFSWNKGEPPNVKDFSVNLNPLGVPKEIEELIKDAINLKVYRYYPQYNYKCLKENIGEIFDVNPSYIEIYNGVSEFLSLLTDEYSCPQPNYGEYPCYNKYTVKEEGNSYVYDLRGTKVITSNPVNPTGSLIDESEILEFLADKRELVLDESFMDLSDGKSFTNKIEEYPNLVVLSSFTKSLSIPGLRMGFSFSIKQKVRPIPWRVNSIANYVFSNANPKKIREFLNKSKEKIIEIRDNFEKMFPFKIYDTHAPFVLVEFPIPTKIINKFLIENGYYIREPEGFIGLRDTHARISLRDDVQDLVKVLNSLSPKTFKLKS
jgi:histidinol-phosphate aminotransferase